jgi:DNA adenine methylase
MRYSGGKEKTYPHLINLMPPHEIYIESHLGGGAVMRHKRAAERQIGIDIDPSVIEGWFRITDCPCELVFGDAVQYLNTLTLNQNALIYADPPYVLSTRRRSRVYRFDYTDDDHERLIECLLASRCMVMISGYGSPLYESRFTRWRRVSFSAKTHTGIRHESVWLNFDPPNCLHDSSHLGENFRRREVVKKRRTRLQSRIRNLSMIEQHGLLQWLQSQLGEAQ